MACNQPCHFGLDYLILLDNPSIANTLAGKVVKVYDDDTVTILDASNTQYRISLQDIDAPECGQAYGKKSGKYC